MKKIIFIISLFFLAIFTSTAQTPIPTPKFKGIEVCGDASDFINSLKKAGCVVEDTREGDYVLSGTFAGYSDSEIMVICTKEKNLVAKVVVYLPKNETWSSILERYTSLKATYISKYGEPKSDYHFFSSPYELGDGYETTAVRNEKCIYSSFWSIDGYNLNVEISKYMQVKVVYENDKNMDILIAEKKNKQSEDI